MNRFPPIKKIFELNGITNFELSPSFTLLMLISYLIHGRELDEQRESKKGTRDLLSPSRCLIRCTTNNYLQVYIY